MKSFIAIVLGSLIFTQALAAEFVVRSPDIKPASSLGEEQVFNGFGCQGGNISPALIGPGRRSVPRAMPSPYTTQMRRRVAAGGTG